MLFVTDYVQFIQQYLENKALKEFGDFKRGGQVIRSVKHAYGLLLLAKEQTVLQEMIDRLTEIVRCYRMEVNVEKPKARII